MSLSRELLSERSVTMLAKSSAQMFDHALGLVGHVHVAGAK